MLPNRGKIWRLSSLSSLIVGLLIWIFLVLNLVLSVDKCLRILTLFLIVPVLIECIVFGEYAFEISTCKTKISKFLEALAFGISGIIGYWFLEAEKYEQSFSHTKRSFSLRKRYLQGAIVITLCSIVLSYVSIYQAIKLGNNGIDTRANFLFSILLFTFTFFYILWAIFQARKLGTGRKNPIDNGKDIKNTAIFYISFVIIAAFVFVLWYAERYLGIK